MIHLLDTNVLSEQRKRRPNPGVVEWFAHSRVEDLRVSVMTIGEVRRGITLLQLRRDHVQAERYEQWLDATVREFAERIVPVTVAAAQRWGHHDAARPMPIVDGLIGATAEVHGWTLVTRNTRDFEHTGVALLNPFAG